MVPEEACPLNLAPTASTTAALALGDALAMVLLESRGLTREDFARYHPAGTLGMTLLLRVKDIMRTGDACPVLQEAKTTVQAAIFAMTKAKAGAVALVDGKGKLSGIFTDGDLRRALDRNVDVHRTRMVEVMTRGGKSVRPGVMAVEAVSVMQDRTASPRWWWWTKATRSAARSTCTISCAQESFELRPTTCRSCAHRTGGVRR